MTDHEPVRLLQHLREGGDADAVGHVAQTRHQQLAATDERGAEAMWAVAGAAARFSTPRLERLRFVTITSDAAGSFAAWVQSLRTALDDAGWLRGSGPDVELLRVANDADPSIDAAHRMVSADGITIRVVNIDAGSRPLPLAEARPFAFRHMQDLGWIPSARAPVWSLDEDFRFDTLAPSPSAMFVRRAGGPLLHRLDAVIARIAADGVDVIIGGNTGAAPVPALGLVLRQIQDLASDIVPGTSSGTPLEVLSQLSDAYYDLAREKAPALRVPLTRAWWRTDGLIEPSEIVGRFQAGLPVTRPALAMPLQHPPSAWSTHDHDGVAGGNTLLLSPRALDARFVHVQSGSLISRRADTAWVIDARTRGARVVRACLPLFHDRQRSPESPADAAREALADALGVGVYQSMLAGDASEGSIRARAEGRLAAMRTYLLAAEATARRSSIGREYFEALADWIAEARSSLVLTKSVPVILQ
ncbi:MAG TPA: hypothetical protein VGM88_25465 [Kofleriaceae bacterium]